jgi:hypothetical protein
MEFDIRKLNTYPTAKLLFEITGIFLAVGFFVTSLYLVYRHTLGSMTTLAWMPWGYSELLINYNAGFVRRGLLGALIRACSGGRSALPVTNVLIFANYVLLILSVITLALKTAYIKVWNAVFVLVIPGGIFAMGISHEFFYRKEAFFYSALALSALAVSFLNNIKHSILKHSAAYCIIGLIYLFSILFMLIHEAFLFLAAPANLFLLIAAARTIETTPDPSKKDFGFEKSIILTYASTITLLFLCMAYFRGGESTAVHIWNNLNTTDKFMISSDGTIYGGIAAVGWDFGDVLYNALRVLIGGMAWY